MKFLGDMLCSVSVSLLPEQPIRHRFVYTCGTGESDSIPPDEFCVTNWVLCNQCGVITCDTH